MQVQHKRKVSFKNLPALVSDDVVSKTISENGMLAGSSPVVLQQYLTPANNGQDGSVTDITSASAYTTRYTPLFFSCSFDSLL